jgi:hypothetical protein
MKRNLTYDRNVQRHNKDINVFFKLFSGRTVRGKIALRK